MPTSTMQLFLSMMRNARSSEMNRAMIGYTVEQNFPPVTREAIAEFARATCDDNPAYDSAQAPAPPFFIGKLIIPLVKRHMGSSVPWAESIENRSDLPISDLARPHPRRG